jgi:hypothetical protein
MMDSKLFADLLTELLRLPAARLTQEKILANLTLAATAAGLSLTTEGSVLQREHLQLAAALEQFAVQLGDNYRARAMLRLGTGIEGVELGAVIEPIDSTSPLPRFCAFGSTARATLARLNADIAAAHRQPPAPPPPRTGGKLTLKRLANQLEADKANAA